MTPEQIAEGQRLAREFKPRKALDWDASMSSKGIADSKPLSGGTGFFISEDGFLVTNEHVVRDAAQVRLVTSAGLISARVVKVDAANDLALLKAEGRFAALPVAASRAVKFGRHGGHGGFFQHRLASFAPVFNRRKQRKQRIISDRPFAHHVIPLCCLRYLLLAIRPRRARSRRCRAFLAPEWFHSPTHPEVHTQVSSRESKSGFVHADDSFVFQDAGNCYHGYTRFATPK